MNFYKRYPGDYAKKTARLTLAQHGAYTLLLDEFYLSEAGLPGEFDDLYRICRSMSKPEQEAVRVVADRFFPICEDGLRYNSRANDELLDAAPAIEAARSNGKKGGRPRKQTQQEPIGLSNPEPNGNPLGYQNKTQSEPISKAPQSSELREDRGEGKARKRATPPPDRPDDVAEQTWVDWTRLRKEKHAAVTPTVVSEARSESEKAGLTLERFLALWCLRGSQGLQADWLRPDERKPINGNHAEPDWRREQRERMQQAAPYAVVRSTGRDSKTTDVEAKNAPARIPG